MTTTIGRPKKDHPHSFPSDDILKPKHHIMRRNEKGQIVGDVPGNPFPKGPVTSLTKIIREYAIHHPAKAYRLIDKLYDMGIAGNMMAISTILERIDGKVTDKVEMDIKPVVLRFVPAETLLNAQVEPPLALGTGTTQPTLDVVVDNNDSVDTAST